MIQKATFQLENLSASLGGVPVLHALHLSIPSHTWVSIVGPNGAGKSTLLKVLAGLLPNTGTVRFFEQTLSQWPPKQRARALAWLGQNESVVDDLSVYDVVMLGRLPHQHWLAAPSAKDHAAVEQAMQQTHTWNWRERGLEQLSGGERQRVLLARALAVQAQVLLMDEPLMHLDPPHQADWMVLVRDLVSSGTTVVSVLHEISIALHAAHMLIMDKGRVVHQGASSEAATHRALEGVFEHKLVVHSVAGQWIVLPKFPPPGSEKIQR